MSTRPCAWQRCKAKVLGPDLRWILLGLSLPLLAGIWWWTARRAGQAPGNAELRESTPPLDPRHADGGDVDMRPDPEARDLGVSPFEPLNIHTADFDRVPVLDGPMMVNTDPAPAPATVRAPAPGTGPVYEPSEPAATAAPVLNAPALQRIVTIRVCSVGETRWS